VVVDLHTTNAAPTATSSRTRGRSSPSAHPALLDLLEHDWLPELRRRVRDHAGFELFDYGNFMKPDGDEKDDPDTVTAGAPSITARAREQLRRLRTAWRS